MRIGKTKLRVYQTTAIFSMILAVFGFSYNIWRMEVTEKNNSSREACFELLLQLSELEQLVYAAHYDKNKELGNPRNGWIKVGLIGDLSFVTELPVREKAVDLKNVWQSNWSAMEESRVATDKIVDAIDEVRLAVRLVIASLE